jgi:hypothetical protein
MQQRRQRDRLECGGVQAWGSVGTPDAMHGGVGQAVGDQEEERRAGCAVGERRTAWHRAS